MAPLQRMQETEDIEEQILPELRPTNESVKSMTERFMYIGMIAFYAILIVICLFSLYQIYKMIMAIVYQLIDDAYEEGKYEGEKEKEENGGSGTFTRGTELSGSNGGYAQKEEEGKCPQKKID